MSHMSNLHAILTERGELPEYPDDSDYDAPPTPAPKVFRCELCDHPVNEYCPGGLRAYPSGGDDRVLVHETCPAVYRVANGDQYLAVTDEDGITVFVAEGCPPHLWHEFLVPRDGIELRHGPMTKVE